MHTLSDSKTEKVAEIIRDLDTAPIRRLLVVGCGDGIEAAILATHLDASVTGIDVFDSFDGRASAIADLRVGDAMNLEFEDETFDFVFSYHALEHIADPRKALAEINRVLRPEGGFWIGTPNRSRLVGYIGAKEGSLADRIRWNLVDYVARLRGRFRNDLGAHAGFTAKELKEMLEQQFPVVEEFSDRYFQTIYPQFGSILRRLSLISTILYPSVYFSGRKS